MIFELPSALNRSDCTHVADVPQHPQLCELESCQTIYTCLSMGDTACKLCYLAARSGHAHSATVWQHAVVEVCRLARMFQAVRLEAGLAGSMMLLARSHR